MADGVNVDFGAMKPGPDVVGGYVNAFKVGQDLGKVSAMRNAPSGVDPAAAAAAASPAEPGDISSLAAQIAVPPGQERSAKIMQAQTVNEQLAHVLIGLKQYPPEQRVGIARHLALSTGLLNPATITPEDVTDRGIDAHLAQAMRVERFLSQQVVQVQSANSREQGANAPANISPVQGGQDSMNAKHAADTHGRGSPLGAIPPEQALAARPVRALAPAAAPPAQADGVRYIGPAA